MFKEFFIKKMLLSKGVPKEQIEPLMEMINKNPALFQQIAGEVDEKMKSKKMDQMAATMEVLTKHKAELEKIFRP